MGRICSACVQTPRAGPEVSNLEEAAGDHYVLQKMDHLVLVTEVAVKEERVAKLNTAITSDARRTR